MSGHTPGPWRWESNLRHRNVVLRGGRPLYDLTVMDFVRWGMTNAAPRFREDIDGLNVMRRCDEHAMIVPGREHHADWFRAIDHADAHLIAAAPDLLAALTALVERCEYLDDAGPCGEGYKSQEFDAEIEAARTAITKAKGGQP